MTPQNPHVRTSLSSCEARRKCTGFYTLFQLVRIEVNQKPAIKASMKMVKETTDINNILHTLSIHIDEDIVRCAQRTRAGSGTARKRGREGIDPMAPAASLHGRSAFSSSTEQSAVNHHDKIFSIDHWQIA